LTQQEDGSITLPASEAKTHGDQIRYESGANRDNVGFWLNPADWADWDLNIKKTGRFEVFVDSAAPETAQLEIEMGQQKLKAEVPVTGDYGNFKSGRFGVVDIKSAGKTTLTLHSVADGWHPVNVRSIRLVPFAAGN